MSDPIDVTNVALILIGIPLAALLGMLVWGLIIQPFRDRSQKSKAND